MNDEIRYFLFAKCGGDVIDQYPTVYLQIFANVYNILFNTNAALFLPT